MIGEKINVNKRELKVGLKLCEVETKRDATRSFEPSGLWVHELVTYQASERPEALAVQDEHRQLTFGELERQSNRLAWHLRAMGVGPEVAVGLYFERSVDFVVAALAVLKAGGAYVPLDVAYPAKRIEAILRDANVAVLLSHKRIAASIGTGQWKTCDSDVDAECIAKHSAAPLNAPIEGQQLAYVIYTSGSSGEPKGVEISHANLQHLVHWHWCTFAVSPGDRASQVAGLAFDAAVWEIWCNLAAGASLYIIDEVNRRIAQGFKEWLLRNCITIAFAPTLLAEQLMVLGWPPHCELRLLLTGGDLLHRYPKGHLPFTVINNYGPTECTVLVTSGPVRTENAVSLLPAIGRAIDDMEILIVDANLERVAAGEEGEICVAGPQIGRGYRNLPELTSEKFTTLPGSSLRIYRTGDRGKVLLDGSLAFSGRLDDEIKIRGSRVEPDEIIAQLNTHPKIVNSSVALKDESEVDKSLVAYVVATKGSSLSASELREYLQERLPEYMVPSVYVELAALPVTTTGKCAKAALPEPSRENQLPEWNDHSLPPGMKTATEAQVSLLLSGLMKGRTIRRHDNFFRVGGHSMLAAQLLARIQESFQVSLRLRELFEAPNIASLAALVARKLAAK